MSQRNPIGAPLLLSVLFMLTGMTIALATQTVELPQRLEGHGGPVKAIAISPDGTEALTGSFDYSIIHWSLDGEKGKVIAVLTGHKAAVNGVSFVPGTELAVSGGDDGAVAIWDIGNSRLLKLIDDGGPKVLDMAVSPDGKLAAAARWDMTVRIYDLVGMREISRFEGHRGNVNAVTFSSDSKFVYSAAYDGTIRGWDIAAGTDRVVLSHGWGINVLALLPDGRIAYGGLDGEIGAVDPATGETQSAGNYERPILSVTVNVERGLLAAGGADGHIRVFDAETLIEVEDYNEPYGPVWALDFLPDGRSMYRGGLDDFASRWQVDPRQPFEKTASVYPRRFQITESGDPGEREFMRKCSICHTLEPDGANRAGPTLYGLIGRKAGTVAGYPYTEALRRSGIIWTEDAVARLFDEGPDKVVPGTKMPIQRLKAVERRDALIEFLKRAGGDGAAAPK